MADTHPPLQDLEAHFAACTDLPLTAIWQRFGYKGGRKFSACSAILG